MQGIVINVRAFLYPCVLQSRTVYQEPQKYRTAFQYKFEQYISQVSGR